MPKATYYYDNGRGGLSEVSVEADNDGNLIREGEKEPFCTGAKAADSPVNGCYVPAAGRKSRKKDEPEKRDSENESENKDLTLPAP